MVSIFFTDGIYFCFYGIMVQTDKRKEGLTVQDVNELAASFKQCQKTMVALGDQNRQHLILTMLQSGECNGLRVGEITAKTHLSRPAVSHHLGILKDVGIVKVRKEGTKNYYYFASEMQAFEQLIATLQLAVDIARGLPDRSN